MDILIDKYIMSLYTDLEDEVIADIARRVKKTGRHTETAELMAKSMHELGYSPEKIQAEVMKKLRADKALQMEIAENTKAYKQEIQDIIDATVRMARIEGNALIAEAGNMAWNNDLSMWEQQGVDLKKPNTMNQMILAFQKQTNDALKNLTQTTGFKNTVFGTTGVLNMYQREMDLALLKVSTGTFSYDQAVNDCIHRLAQSGLRSIDYANGRTYQLDTAVRMSVRTGLSQLSGKVMEENLKSTGQDLVITSQHMGSRPEHAGWQNKVFSFSGKSKKYPSLEEGTGYGRADGLKGVNCTHDFYPFWEGASVIPEDIKEPDPVTINGKEYDYFQATQKQRQMERNIRATKREIEAQKAIGGDVSELQSRLRKQTAEYYKFSNDVGIRAKDNRLRVKKGTSDLKKSKETVKKQAAHSVNTGKRVYFDENKDYRIRLSGYADQVNDSLSKASKELAKKGSKDGYEHGVFVDLNTGKIDKYVTNGEQGSVVPNYQYLKNNPNANVAFLHNHNEDTELSFPDVAILANEKGINVVAAVRNDGIITLVESNGKKTSSYLPLEYLEYANELREKMMSQDGSISDIKLELMLRDKAINEFASEGMKIYGSNT